MTALEGREPVPEFDVTRIVGRPNPVGERAQRGRVTKFAVLLASAVLLTGAHAAAQTEDSAVEASQTALAATAPTLDELIGLSKQLASADPRARKQAFESLLALDEDALPAIRQRLTGLAQRGFEQDPVLDAFTEFRKVQGVDAPDGAVDLAQGVLRSLERSRSAGTVLGAELIGLLRALEAQRSPEAAELIVSRLLPLSSKLFRYEAPRIRERLSVLLLPAFIRHQNHSKPWVRAFCVDSLKAMAITSPGRAVQQDDVRLLSAILTAYGETLTFDAMPTIVVYLTDERLEVQSAARRAIARFGRNAIWQIRERYVNATGKDADPTWSHQRLLKELYRLHDEPKQQLFNAEFARAQKALEAESHAEARDALLAALRVAPSQEEAQRAAPLFTQLAEHAFSEQQAESALSDYRRALRLSEDAAHKQLLRARIAYLEGELRLADGVLDLPSFERATLLDPSFAPAEAAYDELSGARSTREAQQRRVLGFVAALLMALSGFALLRSPRAHTSDSPEPTESPDDETPPSSSPTPTA